MLFRYQNLLPAMDSATPFPAENLTTTTTREFKHHVVMFPFMAQGHIIPFLELAKLLAKRTGFAITIANTPLNIRSLRPEIDSTGAGLDIRLAELPFSTAGHGLPPQTENTDFLPYNLFFPFLQASEQLEPHFERLICRICQEDGGRLPLCIISDMAFGWTLDVGNRLGIPRIQFCTAGAYGTSVYYSLWTHLPHNQTHADDFVLPDMPHVTLQRSQLPTNIKMATGSDPWSLFMNRQISRNVRSWGSICNTFEQLEHSSLQHMRKSTGRPVWAVGPILPSSLLSSSPSNTKLDSDFLLRGKQTEAKSARACLQWLDSQAPSTVLYVSFGSQNSISLSNMKALALGLESSQQPFIWVVRPPVEAPLNSELSAEFLSDGFEERVKEKKLGLLIRKWAPQLLILSHPSTGGFLSHCGWNSVLESLSQGIPIIGWPMAGDQFTNSKVLEEEMEVCIEMWRGKEGELKPETVERTVRMVMKEEKGNRLRQRAAEIREAALKAVSEDKNGEKKGSSVCAVDDMIRELTVGYQC
uniref:Glycosyltransferase n=1 Tax=Picea sitchensis TaxID=3332 RepID=B8LMC6_PICSI|nr:unknown [Picea sitchensis]